VIHPSPSVPAAGDPVRAPWLASLRARPGTAALAILSFGAAAIHFAVSPEHFAEWVPYGLAFALLAWFQLLWSAAYLAGPTGRQARVAIIVNTAVVAVWAWSRTVGLPIGPEPGAAEAIGFADVLASALEAALVIGLLAAGTGLAPRAAAWARRRTLAVTLAALVAVVALTVLALAVLAPAPMAMG